MRNSPPSPWLNRFAWLLAAATVLLVCSGGMVTSKNVGLAVPDWPTTFGYNMFLFPASQWVGGIFFEHTHRLIASTIGFLTIILAGWLSLREPRRWVRNLGWAALGAVVLQGLLGGLRVTLLKDEIGIFHACLAQGFLALLVLIALVMSGLWRRISEENAPRVRGRAPAFFALGISFLIYGQLALGATMRHQHRDLAILDFPTAYGKLLPATDSAALASINAWRDARALSDVTAAQIWLQMAHRFGALVIAISVLAFWFAVRRAAACNLQLATLRSLTHVWLLLIAIQVTLGAWTIWSNKAADIATAHVAIGAISLATGVLLSAICWRMSVSPMEEASKSAPMLETALH